MFSRNIYQYLKSWKNRQHRKPLLIRGARQVGKTVAMLEFAKSHFRDTIYLNLEKADDRNIFREVLRLPELVQLIQLHSGKKLHPHDTILVIDEIQNSAVAMTQLRYFYEEIPELHVLAAGSLLDAKLTQEGFSFPVGRVEYCYMHPVTFDEYLHAIQDEETIRFLDNLDIRATLPEATHELLLKKYYDYVIVGGMPEAVAQHSVGQSFIDLDTIYESLLISYRDDVFKYASRARAVYLHYLLEHSPEYVGTRIKYEKFGGSRFRSREMREAFDTLEKAMILHRIPASPSVGVPLTVSLRKSPKLAFLDMGLVNYQLAFRENILNISDLNSAYRGQIAEQIVAQALRSLFIAREPQLAFWYRERKGSTAEVDYLLVHHHHLLPIEVKSGKIGRLKSLHRFMAESGQPLAIRVYSGKPLVQMVTVDEQTTYMLLSLPFYLLHRILDISAEWFSREQL